MTTYLKATGNSGYTLYAIGDEAAGCEIYYDRDTFSFHELGPEWTVERIKGQFGATEVGV